MAPNGQPLAGFGDRFLAYLIDSVIHFAVSMVLMIPAMIAGFALMFSWMEGAPPTFDPGDPYGAQPTPREMFAEMMKIYLVVFLIIGVVIALGLLFTYLYFVEYQLRGGGQTVGKRVMKITVVPVHPAQPLTRMDLVKRWSVQYLIGAFVSLFTLIDGLWQLWDKPLQQCLHDKAAATVVVKAG